MIRPLTNNQYQSIEFYLSNDHFNNIYLIHALQTYGVESKNAIFFGAFKNKKIVGVLYIEIIEGLRFGSLCGDSNKILKQLGRYALKNGINVLTGKKDYITPIIEEQHDRNDLVEQYDFYRINPNQLIGRYEYPVQRAIMDDIPILIDLYKTSELGNTKKKDRRVIELEIKRTMKYESGYFFIKSHGRAVSVSRIVAETDKVGVIDGSTTLPENRGQGMHPSVRTAGFEYLFQKDKIGLGYIRESDSIMHKMIKKTGGTFIEKWLIVLVNQKPNSIQIFKKSCATLYRGVHNYLRDRRVFRF